MTEIKYYQQDTDLWHQLIDREKAYLEIRQNFLNSCQSKVELIRLALQNPTERGTALEILNYLTLEERQSLFDELIKLASVGHSDIELVRSAILAFDKIWLLDNIENHAESLLKNGTDEEYRRLLELYIQIDDELTQRLVMKALQQNDSEIQEAGGDFEIILKTKRENLM
ncbi:hypothetical protein WA1_28285 [Scytonema hofmannii PCC 7110]|uniref:Uncharacterized protein n=1 Tax=Scytonema hofmannii PCC 7110 TaxID=128403 RepID=A0A139X5A2_9CYAN|nr:hypothetical protein [Scytonema hofmannii]KYC39870.1 hypothetical protein WA1_28285 [Scytonema hofmannii PCC 7110]